MVKEKKKKMIDRLSKKHISRSRKRQARKSKKKSRSNSPYLKNNVIDSPSSNKVQIKITKPKQSVSRFDNGELGNSFGTKNPEIPSPFIDTKEIRSVSHYTFI